MKRMSLSSGCWSGIAVTVLAFGGPVAAATQSSRPGVVNVDIRSQPIGAALNELAQQAGIQLLFFTDVASDLKRPAPALVGTFATDEALLKLLANTGLTFSYVNERTVAVHRVASAVSGDKTTQAEAVPPVIRLANDLQLSRTTNSEAAAETSSPAVGSDNSSESRRNLEEVIVTAQKRDELLQDVPIPVTAISSDTLIESNQNRIQEFYTRIPSLNVTPSVQGQQNLSIRGITTGFSNPTVGVIIDDVPFGSSGGLPSGLMAPDLDPGDLARVEVLRGPQGALYGASSMGGLFKMVTVDPSTEGLSGRVQAGASGIRNGDEMGYNIRALVNVPLSEAVAVRASAFTRHDPGYIDNIATGQNGINSADVNGGRISALFRPSQNFSLKLSAMYQDYEGDGQSEVDNIAGAGDLQQSRLIDSGVFDRELQAYSAVVNADLGAAELTSVTGYNISDTHDTFDYTGPFAPAFVPIYGSNIGLPVYTDALVRRFTQEMRLAFPVGSKIDWLLGGFYSRESNDFDQHTTVVNFTTGDLLGYRNILDNGALRIRERAAFTNVTYHFTDRFDVQMGGRYSEVDQSKGPGTAQRFPPTGNGLVTITLPISAEADEVFTYLFTPRFKVSEDLMVYMRAASGYRIGGGGITSPNDNCVRFNYPCQYGADKTQNYEVGAKGNLLDRLLSFDASLYYIDWKDIQIQGYSAAAGSTYNTNGSRARSQGVELSVQTRPTDTLQISVWGVYSNAELTESLPTGPGLPIGRDGDRLPLGSEWSGSFSVDQELIVTSDISGSVGASVSYIGERMGLFATDGIRVTYPSYTKLDLVGRLAYNSWAAELFVNNVTDRHTELSGGPGFFPPTSAAIVQPRTYGISLVKTF